MKKILVIFVALIGFSVSLQSEESSYSNTYLAWTNANNCVCPQCDVKLRSEQRTEEKWFDCFNCGGEGRVTCGVLQTCDYCGGNGCRDGYYYKDTGKCSKGTCSYCQGTGKRQKMTQRGCKCNASGCNYNSRSGRYGKWDIGRRYNVLVCPRCSREYSGC